MLRIGLIAFSPEVMVNFVLPHIIELEEERGNMCIEKNKNRLVFKDDSIYTPIYKQENISGLRLDQLFICDDYRWLVYCEQHDLIAQTKIIFDKSPVPYDYIVQELKIE